MAQRILIDLDEMMLALRRELLPKAPRDDYGSESERLAQKIDELEVKFKLAALSAR